MVHNLRPDTQNRKFDDNPRKAIARWQSLRAKYRGYAGPGKGAQGAALECQKWEEARAVPAKVVDMQAQFPGGV